MSLTGSILGGTNHYVDRENMEINNSAATWVPVCSGRRLPAGSGSLEQSSPPRLVELQTCTGHLLHPQINSLICWLRWIVEMYSRRAQNTRLSFSVQASSSPLWTFQCAFITGADNLCCKNDARGARQSFRSACTRRTNRLPFITMHFSNLDTHEPLPSHLSRGRNVDLVKS